MLRAELGTDFKHPANRWDVPDPGSLATLEVLKLYNDQLNHYPTELTL
jgi:hypothetical protein